MKAEETQYIKNCLKDFLYRIKVQHGKGTASGWIKAYIPKDKWEADHRLVELRIQLATNRPDTENNHIVVCAYE